MDMVDFCSLVTNLMSFVSGCLHLNTMLTLLLAMVADVYTF